VGTGQEVARVAHPLLNGTRNMCERASSSVSKTVNRSFTRRFQEAQQGGGKSKGRAVAVD